MTAVYHLKPGRMVGTTLWPFAQLAEVDPTAYERAARKYAGRPGMRRRPVELLGCAWGECIFLCPVDPRRLMEAARVGRPDLPERDWFAVDTELLDPDRTVLMRPSRWSLEDGPPPVTADACEPFTPAALADASEPGKETLARLADPTNRLPLFVDVLHVLHRGPIPVDATPVVRA